VHVMSDSVRIFSFGFDWHVRVWDAVSGASLLATPLDSPGHGGAAFFADGQQFVSRTTDGHLALWDSFSGAQTRVITTDKAFHSQLMVLSPNGALVASAKDDFVDILDPSVNVTNESRRMWVHIFVGALIFFGWYPDCSCCNRRSIS